MFLPPILLQQNFERFLQCKKAIVCKCYCFFIWCDIIRNENKHCKSLKPIHISTKIALFSQGAIFIYKSKSPCDGRGFILFRHSYAGFYFKISYLKRNVFERLMCEVEFWEVFSKVCTKPSRLCHQCITKCQSRFSISVFKALITTDHSS